MNQAKRKSVPLFDDRVAKANKLFRIRKKSVKQNPNRYGEQEPVRSSGADCQFIDVQGLRTLAYASR